MRRIDGWTIVLSTFFITFAGVLLFALVTFGQTACLANQSGRWVVTAYYSGYQQKSFYSNDRACVIELVRRFRGEGARLYNPYSRASVWIAATNFELMDTQDPNDAKGETRKLLAEALPGAVSIP